MVDPATLLAPEAFSALALEAQLQWLDQARVAHRVAPTELLALTAEVRDHAPMAHLSRALLDEGWLDEPARAAWFAGFLLEQPDTAVHKVLRQLVEPAPGRERRLALRRVLETAWHEAPLERLAAMCLVDRTFKHHFAAERDEVLARRVEQCRQGLSSADGIPLPWLAQVPGRLVGELRREAARVGGQAAVDVFDRCRALLAERAIAILGDTPKAVSQANAEELLARRVYTDPGHFLVELLQNAEDSGARRWHVDFLPRRIVVWHDGAPFDARDLVGVTSIGQTTKRKSQIGFFGVGFKSVYEVTERPQIFSDVYLFEIADVSIPKRLGARPVEAPQDGTVLVLPLRDPEDPARSARALFDKARQLDPIVLLTLRHIRTIALRHVGLDGVETRHVMGAEEGQGGLVTVSQQPDGWSRTFAVHGAALRFDQGPREAARTTETNLEIGVLWQDGLPRPLSEGTPTVYSWLPTAEPSGLRFFIQSHFDVPVDRERITAESVWNRWILSHVPALLAEVVRHTVEGAGEGGAAERAAALLEVLPRAEELSGAHWRSVATGLRRALFERPCLPTVGGTVEAPRQAVVVSAPIAAALDGLPLVRRWFVPSPGDSGELPCQLVSPALPARSLEVARQLGALELDHERLISALERALGEPFNRLQAAWIEAPARLLPLYDLLLEHVDQLERLGQRVGAARTLERLRALPMLLDADGELRTADAVWRGRPELRALGSPQAWLAPELDDLVGEGRGRLAAFLDRLGVRVFGLHELLRDLQRQLEGRPQSVSAGLDPADPGCPAALAERERRGRLLRLALEAPWADLHLAATLPIFLATDGHLYPSARDATDRRGVLRSTDDAFGRRLVAFWADRRPLLAPPDAADPERVLQHELLSRLSTPTLSIDTLIFDLWMEPPLFPLGKESGFILALHELIAELLPEIPPRARERLAALPIWPDTNGALLPLVGSGGRALVPVDEAVCGLFPAAPFLDARLRELAHVRAFGGEVVGVEAVIGALAPDASPPLALEARPEVVQAVLTFILEHLGHVRERSRRRLLVFPVFLDDLGRVRPIGELSRADGAGLRSLFAGWSERRFVEPGSVTVEVIERLDLGAHLQPVDVCTLVDDLAHRVRRPGEMGAWLARWLPSERHGEWLEAVQTALVDHRDVLAERFAPVFRPGLPPANPTLNGLPIWRVEAGDVVPASAVVTSDELAPLCEPGTPERARVAGHTLPAGAAARFEALEPLIAGRPPVDLLLELMDALARDGQPLSAQPSFLGSVERVVKVIALLASVRDTPVASRVPLIDASERLRLAPLHNTDPDTRALIEALPLGADLVHPALTAALATAPEAVRPLVGGRLSALEPLDVIVAVERHVGTPGLEVSARHAVLAAFWRWLVAREHDVFTSAECRQRLRTAPLFVTGRGRLVAASELIIDPSGAVPADLGVDWAPSPDIPEATLQRLARSLDVGQPDPAEMVVQHLLPSYEAAVAARERERAAKLLGAMGQLLRGRSWDAIRTLVNPGGDRPGLMIEDDEGRFRPPGTLMLPGPELLRYVQDVWGDELPTPSAARYGEEVHPFLLAIGVKRAPSLSDLAEVLERPGLERAAARGVAAICGHLHREGAEHLLDALPLRTLAWVPDGTGCLRRPGEVYLWSAELEGILGAWPELYVDELIPLLLGRELTVAVGFRGAGDVRLTEVVNHLRRQSQSHQPVAFALYRWLERGLAEGRLEPQELVRRLSPMPWVCTDDGEYFEHRRVLGSRALRLFGGRRGYWERGREQCPRLFQTFGIPPEVTAEVVSHFLDEIAADVRQHGDPWTLDREKALPRMLLACYAWLGRAGGAVPEGWPVILAAPAGRRGGADGSLRLLPARSAGLLRSDTPTLEKLFAGVGPFFLASRGEGEEEAAVDAFLERSGVVLLRDAVGITTEVHPEQDRTSGFRAEILSLRGTLAALLEVMPRIQLQRSQLDPGGWLYDARLKPLVNTGAIAAIDGLRVFHELPGVGRVPAPPVLAWERERARLLVDTRALAALDRDTTGLAIGLMATLYQGRGEDQLVDIVEILLPLRTAERMHHYLDRRHFPVAQRRHGPLDRIARRVGELLDYDLHLRLQRRFDTLRGADFAAWRDPALLDPLRPRLEAGASLHTLARLAATRLLDVLALDEDDLADPELLAALFELLAAPSLSDISVEWLGADWLEGAPEPERAPVASPPPEPARFVGVWPAEGAARPAPEPIDWDAVIAAIQPRPQAGVFQRLSQWLGLSEEPPPAPPAGVTPPAWARQGGNVLAPLDVIPPQLWANAAMRARLGATAPGAQLAYQPAPLPMPWLYGVHTLGASFDRASQSWRPGAIPSRRWFAELPGTGHRVRFGGRLQPGWSQLPIPMLSRLVRPPQALDGTPIEAGPTEPWGTQRVFVAGEHPVEVHFEVELLEAPALTASAPALAGLPPDLLQPVLPLRDLPGSDLRRWLQREATITRTPWERALAVQEFVRANYRHDEGFLDLPQVRQALAALRPGVGYHHLQLLHAGRDEEVLGRGICYELNCLVVELLRHLRVPALVATGWIFDLGFVDRPDHLFAAVITPTAAGPCLLPIDGSSGAHGPMPILPHVRPDTVSVIDPNAAPIPSPWAFPQAHATDVDSRIEVARANEELRLRREAGLLFDAIALISRVHGQRLPDAIEQLRAEAAGHPADALVARLRHVVATLLGDASLVQPMVRLLRGELQRLNELPPEVQELVRRGYARVQTVPVYAVEPV